MPLVEKDVINKIRANTDIVDLIGSYLPLTEKGKNFFCVCPFHDDHSPSMSVSREKQIYSCFSCGATGNVFTFLMNYQNMSFIESVSFLGEKQGIHIEKYEKKINKTYEELYNAYETSLLYYKNNLNSRSGEEARDYLSKRDINEDIIKDFEIGLSLDNNLYKILEKKYNKNKMIDIGLLSENNGKITDTFKNRIIFPIHDNDGNVVAFSGRVYKEEDNSNKYINTKETIIFKKGTILYNYYKAKEHIRKQKEVIICEGFMDVIRLDSIGIKNTVALMGTSFTDEQLKLIMNLKCKVILNLDMDEAGSKATYTIGNMLKVKNILTSVVVYDGAKDSDEYITKYGEEKFKNVLENKISYVDFEMDYLKKNINMNDSVELSKYINKVIESLNDIDDKVLVELKVKELSEKYGINESTINSKLKIKPKVKTKENKIKNKRYNKYEISEIRIIYLMLNYPEVIKKYEKNLGYLVSDDMTELANEIVYFKEKNKGFDYADFLSYIEENDNLKNAFDKITNYNNINSYNEKELEDYFDIVKEYGIKKRINMLSKKMKETYDIEEKKRIASKIEKIKKDVLKW